jgi:hypothetical protein
VSDTGNDPYNWRETTAPQSSVELADVLWDFATAAAKAEFGFRIAAIEQDIAAIREHLTVRVPTQPCDCGAEVFESDGVVYNYAGGRHTCNAAQSLRV